MKVFPETRSPTKVDNHVFITITGSMILLMDYYMSGCQFFYTNMVLQFINSVSIIKPNILLAQGNVTVANYGSTGLGKGDSGRQWFYWPR